MQTTMQGHIAAIRAGEVTKTNVIGLRKALNHAERLRRGLTGNRLSVTPEETDAAIISIWEHKPRVTGVLHDTGLKVLRNPRYRKRLAHVRPIIDALVEFRLVDFEEVGQGYFVPVYQARGADGAFRFVNISWQSGGDGPELR